MPTYPLVTALLVALPALAQAQQILVVDDDHLQMQDAGRPSPTIYTVSPAPHLVIDATKYSFKIPAQLAGKPINSMQVVVSKDRQYSVAWNPQAPRTVLSAETLKPNPGSLPFTGFAAEQRLIFAIGNLDGAKFNVVWVGMAQVK